MGDALITIVTPCLNDREFLPAALQSVLRQDYAELEYVVVDGGSTDGSVEVIREAEDKLAFWVSEPDSGQYAAVNKGFARSTGEIMAWLNSDDMYCHTALRTVAAIFAECPQVEWLTTSTKMNWTVDGGATDPQFTPGYTRRWFLSGEHNGLAGRYRGVIQQESTFWRRSLWDRAGGRLDERYRLAGDFELWTRFWNHAVLYATSVPLGGFRCRPGQRSEDAERYQAEARQILALNTHQVQTPAQCMRQRDLWHRAKYEALTWLRDSRGHYVRYDPQTRSWHTSSRILV